MRSRAVALSSALFAGAAVVLIAAGLLTLGGFSPVSAGRSLILGSLGSSQALLSITLVRSVPLILTGLAVAVAFRAGVWNIGAEGQLYGGAIASVSVALAFAALPAVVLVPLVLGAGAVGGALWALVPTWMRLRLGVGEVITTILMNFLGIYAAAYVVRGPLQEPRGVFPQTDRIVEAARLPAVVPGTRLHAGFLLAIGLSAALAFLLARTRFGFQIRAVGASPPAARVAGLIPADRVIAVAFLGSGALAGLAGAVEVSGVTYALYEGLSPGWGYTAIAVALLAGLRPGGVVATGILFGVLAAGAASMQRDAGVPAVWVRVVEALVILAVLTVDQLGRARPTGADAPALPIEEGQRA